MPVPNNTEGRNSPRDACNLQGSPLDRPFRPDRLYTARVVEDFLRVARRQAHRDTDRAGRYPQARKQEYSDGQY